MTETKTPWCSAGEWPVGRLDLPLPLPFNFPLPAKEKHRLKMIKVRLFILAWYAMVSQSWGSSWMQF